MMRPRRRIAARVVSGLYVFASEAVVVIGAILFAMAVAAIVLAIR